MVLDVCSGIEAEMKNKKGDEANMRNRDGTLLARYSADSAVFIPEATFYMPTTRELARVQSLRLTASAFRSCADGIRGFDQRRADLLVKRARTLELKAAIVLLGESTDADD